MSNEVQNLSESQHDAKLPVMCWAVYQH